VLIGVLVVAGSGEPAGRATAQDAKPALPADLARIPPDSLFVGSLNVSVVWNSDAAKGVRDRAVESFPDLMQEFEKLIGVGIKDIERITMVSAGVGPGGEPVFVIGTKNAIEKERVLKLALPEHAEKNTDNGTIYLGKDRERKAMAFLDGRVFVVGDQAGIEGFVARTVVKKGALSPVLEAAASGKHAIVAGLNGELLGDLKGKADLGPFEPLVAAKSSILTVDLTNKLTANLSGTFADAKDAEAAEKAAEDLRKLLLEQMAKGIEHVQSQGKDWDRIVDLMKLAEASVKDAKLQRKDATVQTTLVVQTDLAALNVTLIDAVHKIRDSAKRMQSQNNLKQIALAMHNYHDTFGAFPPAAIYDKNGKPLLSWRVMILPFVEQDNLYKEFHLDEPWDSEHNKKLLAQMPPIYRAEEEDAKKHLTRYLGFAGKNALFDGAKGIRMADITDGTSNTIMVAEAAKGVPWTKPEDIPFGDGKLLPLVVNPKKGGFNAAFCDGSVHFLRKTVKEAVMRLLVQINDGNPLPADFDK
jgi:prepilin-type processing-associated H-X9-DG protein